MRGFVCGVAATLVVVFGVWLLVVLHGRDKRIIEAWELRNEILELQKDFTGRDAVDFLDKIPCVRGAAENGKSEFDRKRDEAVQRIRGKRTD
jgi:hypothetical protein